MYRKILSSILAFCLLLALTSCAYGGGAAESAGSDLFDDSEIGDNTYEMIIGTCWGNDTSMPNVACNYLKKRVEELSDGRIKVSVNKGTLGGERELYEGVQTNSIQATPSTTGTLGGFIPLAEIFMIPYIFSDWDHVYACADGPLGERIKELGLSENMRILGWWSVGSRGVYGKGEPILTPEDMKGKKIRVMETPFLTALYSAYGAIATPMAWNEVYTALQQGAIDACQSSLVGSSLAHEEVSDYYVLLEENFTMVAFTVSEQWWQSLPGEAKRIIVQAEREARQMCRELDVAVTDGMLMDTVWKNAGCKTYGRDDFDNTPFVELAESLYPQFRDMLSESDAPWFDWVLQTRDNFPLTAPEYPSVSIDF